MSQFDSTAMTYTRHSFGVQVLGHQHSIGHLSVGQTLLPVSRLRLQWESTTGESIPLGVFDAQSLLSNGTSSSVRRLLARHWQTFPVEIIGRSAVSYLDSALSLQLNVNVRVEIVPIENSAKKQHSTIGKQTGLELVSTVVVGVVAELDNSDLVSIPGCLFTLAE